MTDPETMTGIDLQDRKRAGFVFSRMSPDKVVEKAGPGMTIHALI